MILFCSVLLGTDNEVGTCSCGSTRFYTTCRSGVDSAMFRYVAGRNQMNAFRANTRELSLTLSTVFLFHLLLNSAGMYGRCME